MCFKLELQPVNHGDYALPRCVLCGSGGISTPSGDRVCQDWGRQHRPRCCSWATIPVPEPPVPAEHHLQPRRVPALVCPSPVSCPSWVGSAVLARAASCSCAGANTPKITLKNRVQNMLEGRICSQKLCCVTVTASAPRVVFAFRQDFHDYCFQLSQFHHYIYTEV